MNLTQLVEALVLSQATPETILAAVRVAEAQREAEIEASKQKARDRMQRYKDRLGLTQGEWLVLCGLVFDRHGHICVYCGGVATEVDHVLPLIQGGTNDLDNLAPACRACNGGKSGRTPEEWRAPH